MSPAARSIYVWSGYLLVLGVGLALFPNPIFSLLGVAETEEVWIRVVGLVAILLALYYWDGARNQARHFFVATVLGRAFVALGLVALALGDGPWQLILFAGIDAGGSLWTLLALRAS